MISQKNKAENSKKKRDSQSSPLGTEEALESASLYLAFTIHPAEEMRTDFTVSCRVPIGQITHQARGLNSNPMIVLMPTDARYSIQNTRPILATVPPARTLRLIMQKNANPQSALRNSFEAIARGIVLEFCRRGMTAESARPLGQTEAQNPRVAFILMARAISIMAMTTRPAAGIKNPAIEMLRTISTASAL